METTAPPTDDRDLLRAFVEEGSGQAFAGLVKRHADHVYAAALRRVNGDRALAADITQSVFADLARKASGFSAATVPGGWLHRHTGFTSLKMLARERSRRTREQEAAAMQAVDRIPDPPPPEWTATAPYLDAALDALPAGDRDAIVLRFFEQRDFRSVGQALGVNDDTAQKRVSRALEKLRRSLTRRGAMTMGAALPVLLLQWAAPPAPAAVTTPLAGRALAAAAASPAGWWSLLNWRHAAGGLAAAAVLTLPAVLQSRHVGRLQQENAVLRQQTAPLLPTQLAAVPEIRQDALPPEDVADLIASAAKAFQGGSQDVTAVNAGLGFLTKIPQARMIEALGRIGLVPDLPARSLLYKFLLSHWAETDPLAALHYAEQQVPGEDRAMLCSGVLNAWAARNPEAVLGWNQKTRAMDTPPERESLMARIFQSLASRDLTAAFAWLERTEQPNDRGQALRGILETVQSDEARDRVLQVIEQSPDEELRLQSRRAVVEHWARHDPPAAAAWVDTAEPAWQRTRLMDSLGFAWLQNEPAAAAAWWLERAPGPDTLVKIINVWAQQDPNAAGTWLSAQPAGPGSDTARMTFARQVADLDPESALRWAETVSDPPLREDTIDHVWKNWRARDPEAAASFLQASVWPAARAARLESIR